MISRRRSHSRFVRKRNYVTGQVLDCRWRHGDVIDRRAPKLLVDTARDEIFRVARRHRCCLWAGYVYLHRPITYAPGVLVASDPEQTLLPDSTDQIELPIVPSQAARAFRTRCAGCCIEKFIVGTGNRRSLRSISRWAGGHCPIRLCSIGSIFRRACVSSGTNTGTRRRSRKRRSFRTEPICTSFRRRAKSHLDASPCVSVRSFT